MPEDHQELIGTSPKMTKSIYGLPDWFSKNGDANDLLTKIVLKYFTFKAVVWHLEGDNDAMKIYFNKVAPEIKKAIKAKRPLISMMTSLKWFFECYAHLDEFDQCRGILISMKEILLIKVGVPKYISLTKLLEEYQN